MSVPRESGVGYEPTTPFEDGLWYLDQLAADSPAYRICRAYRVSGALDTRALRLAWRAVLDRHEILRSVLVAPDGLPQWRVTVREDDQMSIVDADGPRKSGAPDPDGHTAPLSSAGLLCAGLPAVPMRLSEGPLARLIVAHLVPQEYIVVLLLHQVVSDRYSASLITAELSGCYAAAVDGRPAAAGLPAPVARHADYARWLRGRTDGEELRRHLDWWVATLTPVPRPPRLPVDRQRAGGHPHQGGRICFDWGSEVGVAVGLLSAVEGLAPDVVLLAAFQLMLSRYSGESRVAVSVPVPVRPRPEFNRLVGACDNLLVLCVDLSGNPTFRQLLRQVGARFRDALARREVPFPRLVRALAADRDPDRVPLCDVMFVRHDTPEPALRLPGTAVRAQPLPGVWVRADLTFVVDRVGPSLAGCMEYRAGIFRPDSVWTMLHQLHTLLLAAVATPDAPIDRLPLESAAELRAAVEAADRTAAGAGTQRPVPELVRVAASADPDAVALAWPTGDVSYRELARRAALVTAALRATGVADGQPVAVRTEPGPYHAAVLLGALDAGAYVVCLGGGDMGERGRAVLAEVRPECVVVSGDPDRDALVRWYRAELGGAVVDVASLVAEQGAPLGVPPGAARPASRLDQPAYVTYTSGSTGRPKGIRQSHATLAQFVTWFAGEFGIAPGSRVAQWAAPGYDASLCEIFAALSAGATLCTVPIRIRAHPEKLVEWLDVERITVFQTVPSFAREVLKAIRSGGAEVRLAALDHLLLAGEALSGELAAELRVTLPWVRLVNLYGATESILATWYEVRGDEPPTVPIGQSIPGRQVLVLDDRDEPCPVGVTGNIVVRSPYLTEGYFGADREDEAAFRPVSGPRWSAADTQRWYRTGDLGCRRWDGMLEFRGRRDSQVKFRGTRLELTDVQAVLAADDAVAECAVVPVVGADGLVARLVAYVVPGPGADGGAAVRAGALRARLRLRFGDATPPVSFTTLPRLPRNHGGKVDLRLLAHAHAAAPSSGTAPPNGNPPRTVPEREMAAIWSRLLCREGLVSQDVFFAVGGHSLLLLRLLREIRERFGVDLAPREYFDNPTLAGLAALVEARASANLPGTNTVMEDNYGSG